MKNARELIYQSKTCFSKKEYSKSVQLLEECACFEGNSPETHYLLGKAAYFAGDILKAEKNLRIAVSLDPSEYHYSFFLNQIRIRHHDILPRDRPRLLVGGFINIRYIWERGLKYFADVIQISQFHAGAAPQKNADDVVFYDQAQEDFSEIISKLPSGWVPDYLLWMIPEWRMYPRGIENVPYPTVAFIGDRDTGGIKIYHDLKYFDIVSCNDNETVEIYRRMGAKNVMQLPFYTYLETDQFKVQNNGVRDIDGIFLGGICRSHIYPAYRFRDRILRKLLSFSGKYRILVREPFPDKSRWGEHTMFDYAVNAETLADERVDFSSEGIRKYCETLNRSKIGIIANAQKQLHPMMFETMGCGALAFVEDTNDMAASCFQHGEDIILYNEGNFEELFTYYIENNIERESIAAKGREKAAQFTVAGQIRKAYLILEENNGRQLKDRGILEYTQEDRLIDRGCAEYYTGNIQMALDCFLKASNVDPDNRETLNNIGVASCISSVRSNDPLMKEMLIAKAGESFSKALRIEHRYLMALYNTICFKYYVVNEGFDFEYRQFNHLMEMEDPEIYTFATKGVLFYPNIAKGSLWDLTRNEIGEMQSMFPEHGSEYCAGVAKILHKRVEAIKAEHCIKEGNLGTAAVTVEKAIKLIKTDPELEFLAGDIYYSTGNRDKAKFYYGIGMKSHPLFVKGYFKYLQVLLDGNQTEEAIALCKDLRVLLSGLDPEAFGSSIEAVSQTDDRLMRLSNAAENLILELKKAERCAAQGQTKEAIAAANSVLEKDSTNSRALNVLGFVAHSLGQSKLAIDFFERAYAADPSNCDAGKNYAETLLQSGQREKAVHLYWELARVFPDDQEIVLIIRKMEEIGIKQASDDAR